MVPTTRRFPSGERGRSVRGSVLPLVLGLTAGALVAGAPAAAQSPVTDSAAGWRQSFTARFNARVAPTLGGHPELSDRVAAVWGRLTGIFQRQEPSELLQQYPILCIVDDRFYVMKYRGPEGEESWLVGPEASDGGVPTLTTTLADYLDGVVYKHLVAIGREEEERSRTYEGYQPDLSQLRELNPYQHGRPIRVPDLGPFQNRAVVFTGLGGRLGERELADYEQLKAQAGPRQGLTVAHRSGWGLAVEQADLVRAGGVACRYRTVREVARVADTRVAAGDSRALIRRPVLGAVLAVEGCIAGCDDPDNWTVIWSPAEESPPAVPRRGQPGPFDVEAQPPYPGHG